MSTRKRVDRTYTPGDKRNATSFGRDLARLHLEQRSDEERARAEIDEALSNEEKLVAIYLERRSDEERARAAIDEALSNGEGEISEEFAGRGGGVVSPGLHRWIRIYSDDRRRKAIATVYLRTHDGVLEDMWLARARRAMPPNPADSVEGSRCSFREVTYLASLPEDSEQAHDLYGFEAVVEGTLRENALSDHAGSQGVKGLQPTVQVQVVRSDDLDHRWKFPGVKVRFTVLGPVLLKLRDAGVQRIPLRDLRTAIDRHQEAPGGR